MKLNNNPSIKAQSGLQVFQLPVLQDNYIYILRDESTQKTAVVDPALPEPVNLFLKEKNWKLDFIFTTHHHWDHTGGNIKLKKKWNCPIFGFVEDTHRIPGIDTHLQEGEQFSFGKFPCRILFLPGHTLGHIAYWFFEEKKLFIGDTLFAMGCGRLFEGSPQQMFASLNQIKSSPPETEIFCAHEYTEKNGHFALSVDPQNKNLKNRMTEVKANRKKNKPTVPFFLSEELKTNPFLRATTLEEFTQLRKKRDFF
ncbi:MAG: hydroxyacylglutathione hydrolase [Bdellovibrionales bacterium]|nr:hydroxyacylglutathione hydrolase [Bdellovibrionales bacterium]